MTLKGEDMSHDTLATRDEVAMASAEIAGRSVPLPSSIPEDERLYLFAVPDGFSKTFTTRGLEAEIEKTGVRSGIQRDKDNRMCGARFVSAEACIPEGLLAFSGRAAEAAWRKWKNHLQAMSRDVQDAARTMSAGGDVVFKESAQSERPLRLDGNDRMIAHDEKTRGRDG